MLKRKIAKTMATKPVTKTATKTGLLAMVVLAGACGQPNGGGTVPQDVKSIMFLQRVPQNDSGNVFDYTSYSPGGRLVMLTPPSADGKLTVLTSDPMFTDGDIMSYDISFDAKSVVFSAHLSVEKRYHLFSMNLDGTNIKQLTSGDYDYVYPIYLPGQKIMFTTNKNVEMDPLAKQFRDEYERAVTAQVGTINLDGGGEVLGPRNVSHRVAPALLPDGRVVYTEWRHMGMVNDGHLRMMNGDMTGMREAFGGEEGGTGGTNSYLKARWVQTTTKGGIVNNQMVAIATSRDRTLQAGKLLLINLNGTEQASSFTDLTPMVPGDRVKSELGIGRFYDAEIVGDPNAQQFLVSWADGPVESEFLSLAGSTANFGLYLYNGRTGQRFPIYDDPKYWDVLARPVQTRTEPPPTSSPVSGTSTTIGAINVYDSSLAKIAPGSVVKVRLIEGFSGEEGIRTFGTTEFDGQSRYGEVPISADSSFSAKVPGNVPFHMQLIDKFAMSIVNESIWISGRAGEVRFCGGCHENRAKTPQLQPGLTEAVLKAAVNLDVPRAARVSTDYSYTNIRGVPWDKAIQPFLTAKCATCHNGDASKAYNPTYTVVDKTTGTMQTFTFDLRGDKLNVTVGEMMTGDFTASYLSLMGLGEILGEDVVEITGAYNQYGYVQAGSAVQSPLMKKLNPPQQFPAANAAVRAFPGSTHATDVGAPDLTAEEYYRLILSIDMGGQFFSRENKDSVTDPYAGAK